MISAGVVFQVKGQNVSCYCKYDQPSVFRKNYRFLTLIEPSINRTSEGEMPCKETGVRAKESLISLI